MPFTPFHMGPGMLFKALLQGSFSLMVFGWTQIVIDLQPLYVMIKGEGHLHGFSHTYVGAIIVAGVSAVSGKYLAQLGLYILGIFPSVHTSIPWSVAVISALIGSISHVLLDSVMHIDVQPYAPLSMQNPLWQIISVADLHTLCPTSGVVGLILHATVLIWTRARDKRLSRN